MYSLNNNKPIISKHQWAN